MFFCAFRCFFVACCVFKDWLNISLLYRFRLWRPIAFHFVGKQYVTCDFIASCLRGLSLLYRFASTPGTYEFGGRFSEAVASLSLSLLLAYRFPFCWETICNRCFYRFLFVLAIASLSLLRCVFVAFSDIPRQTGNVNLLFFRRILIEKVFFVFRRFLNRNCLFCVCSTIFA